jgi:hypothetical protein
MRHVQLILSLAVFSWATGVSAQNAAAGAAHTFAVSGAAGRGLFCRGSDATDAGIFLNGRATSQEDQDSRSISIEPTLRHCRAVGRSGVGVAGPRLARPRCGCNLSAHASV